MFITTRDKKVQEIAETSEVIERRRAAIQKAIIVQKSNTGKNWDYIRKTESIESWDFMFKEYPSHQKLINEFKDKSWSGSRCFIIGGGPSLKGFDFSRLSDEFTIAINRAHEFIKDPSIIFFIDEDGFYKELMRGQFGQEAINKFNISRSKRVALNICGQNYGKNIYHIPMSKRPEMTFHLEDGLFDGENSGFAALNLAVCLGIETIYLLGYDMRGDGKGKQAWFHEGYKQKGKERNYKDWIKHFEKVAPLLKRKGIRVVNLNPDSELKCFEFGKIDDIKDLGEKKIHLIGPLGFGDNFYLRSLIKHLSKIYKSIYISTAIPEIFWDIPNVKFVAHRKLDLRTHLKHINKHHKKSFVKVPAEIEVLMWSSCVPTYSWYIHHVSKMPGLSERRSITKFIEQEISICNFDFSFPLKKEWLNNADKIIQSLKIRGKKICIIRPPTIRKEWAAHSRNPKMDYIQLLIDKYKEEYFFISIADIEKDEEWFDGKELQGIDKKFHNGELPITTIFGLIKLSDMMITYPGFFMLAAIAVKSKCFCIFGGFQNPNFILDENMGLENFEHVNPEPFCGCLDMNHNCYKDIPEDKIIEKFESLKNKEKQLKEVSVAVPAGLGDIHWILTKLESFKEKEGIDKINFVLPDQDRVIKKLNRSHYFVELVPFVDSAKIRKYHFLPDFLYTNEGMRKGWHDSDYAFGFNYPLEYGTKLEDILPEYETNFNYPILYPPESREFAEELKKKVGGKLYLLYGSSNGMFRAWTEGKWLVKDWVELAIRIFDSTGCHPVLIGAKWDLDFAENVLKADENDVIYDMVSKTNLAEVFALIREANVLIGFPSGLTILATHFRTPCVMFWSEKGITPKGIFQKGFKTSWVNPEVLKAGEYIPISYGDPNCTVEGIFEKIEAFL